MNSQIATSKVLFRLNDQMFNQNLPHITLTKFNQKQNSSFLFTFDEGFRFSLKKKTLKQFSTPKTIPKLFKKHNNKIQDNMEMRNKTSYDFHSTAAGTKTCSSSFYKPEQTKKEFFKNTMPTKNRSKLSIEEYPKQNFIQPKTLQGIERYFDNKYLKNQEIITVKTKTQNFKVKPRKITKEISQIFQENKHLYMLSRFTLLELKSYYYAILKFSKADPGKFKYAFQIMLNLVNVTVRENIMTQCLKDLISDGITFQKFLKTFANIQEKLRKEAIIDYFEILLEDVNKKNINYEELTKIFQGRMKKQLASELTLLLYENLGKDFGDTISKKQIHTLCYENEQFCAIFYALNSEGGLHDAFKAGSNIKKDLSWKTFEKECDEMSDLKPKSIQVSSLNNQ